MISAINIFLNLLILCVFKYFNFFIENFISLFNRLGIQINWGVWDILLPVGISFYTFQALSYSIDVYKNKIKATHDLIAFSGFISFFPQLVAGPIEKATNLLPQFQQKRTFDSTIAYEGIKQMIWGLFKKLVVADNCAIIVNAIFSSTTSVTGSEYLLGALCFTIQIYGDFSGYSDIAIGCAKLLGFKLQTNFDYPYFAKNIAEFWRKWHISLTTWFKDYVYIPLGGNRHGKWKHIRNTFIIFILSGFWHGANWTFIVWGIYHAFLFIPFILLQQEMKKHNLVVCSKAFLPLKSLAQTFFTFMCVVFGWVIFRSENIGQAGNILSTIFSSSVFVSPDLKKLNILFPLAIVILFSSLLFGGEWYKLYRSNHRDSIFSYKPIQQSVFFFLLICIVFFRGNIQAEFIYFQF